MSLLPQQIIPQTVPIGRVNEHGDVLLDKDWWLLLYNICLNSIGTGGGIPDEGLELLFSTELDAQETGYASLASLQAAIQLAVADILPDAKASAQPAQSVLVGASPFTYTAPFDGQLLLRGGFVESITFIRQGASLAVGLSAGQLMRLSRGDQVMITYGPVAPAATFLPE